MGLLLATSCSDDWNDHYSTDQTSVSNETLWQALESESSLSNFTSVLKACGYNTELSSSQTYTVFAPTNDCFSSAEAQELISEYNTQKSQGVKDAENTVIKQFVKNHIAYYRYPVSSLTNDSISLMNGKYKVLTDKAIGTSNLLSTNKAYSNGELFTVDKQIEYFPNIYEYLNMDADLDSVYNFLSSYDEYEFQSSMSVPGSVNEDGETEYLDSVSVLYNNQLSNLGYINKEDSTYWMVAPTNSEWKRCYDEYIPYYNYSNVVAKHDSLQQAKARQAIIIGSFFSRTTNPDVAFQDSAVCTQAYNWTIRKTMGYDDQYVYYHPFASDGIFSGTTEVECSNGKLLKAADYRIDKKKTFFRDIKIEAENINYQDTLVQCESPLTIREVPTDNPFYDRISNNQYVDVIAKNNSSDPNTWPQPQVRFAVPNTLANVSYDVYVVMAPAEAYNSAASEEDRLPNRFSGFVYYQNQDGKLQQKRIPTKETTPGVVDSILVASDIQFPTCGVDLTTPIVKVQLTSQVSRNQTSKYSNTLHIDCIILKPKDNNN